MKGQWRTQVQPVAIRIDVTEQKVSGRRGWLHCQIGRNIEFSTERLETYCLTEWQPVVYDALLVAAGVEFADKIQRRAAYRWEREIELRVPVHDIERWNDTRVLNCLHDALDFLTGDRWRITFYPRSTPVSPTDQRRFDLPEGSTTIIPFSDGLDSHAVAGLMMQDLGDKLIRVRLGSKASDTRQPFTAVPYRVRGGSRDFVESSGRSRGFKFALVSGLAAYMAKAKQIIVSESGQGALGPALVTVGQAYEDYRSHPLFTERMERFLASLLGHHVRFQFPRIWHTKGETLASFVQQYGRGFDWSSTRSCWQQSRQVSVEHIKRQCGICAACMLRRMSVHAAGLTERRDTYVWEDLTPANFEDGAAASFDRKKITGKLRQYAIAGTLHLDHLAGLLNSQANQRTLELTAFQLSKSLELPEEEVNRKLVRLLTQHASEWTNFVNSLGKYSFVTNWAMSGTI